MPITFCWDNEDARILACETRRLVQLNEKRTPTSMGTMRPKDEISNQANSDANNQVADSQVFILFPTNDNRNVIKSMEIMDLHFGEQLIDMSTPYVVCIR